MRKKVTNWPFRRLWSHCRSFETEGFLIPSDFPCDFLSSRLVIRLGRTESSSIGLHASGHPFRAFSLKRYGLPAGGCQLHGRALSIRFIHVTFPPRRAALRRSFPLLVARLQVPHEIPLGLTTKVVFMACGTSAACCRVAPIWSMVRLTRKKHAKAVKAT